MEIPSVSPSSRWKRESFGAVLGIPLGLIQCFAILGVATTRPKFWVLIILGQLVGVILTVVVALNKYFVHKSKEEKVSPSNGPIELTGCLHVLLEVLRSHKKLKDENAILRAVVHRVSDKHHFEQCIPYVGGSGGDVGRTFNKLSGVIGKCFTTGKMFALERDTSFTLEEWHDFLKRELSVPQEKLHEMNTNTFSFFAAPILNANNEVVAVVYLDCTEPNYFKPGKIKEMAIAGCKGLANFVKQHYNKS